MEVAGSGARRRAVKAVAGRDRRRGWRWQVAAGRRLREARRWVAGGWVGSGRRRASGAVLSAGGEAGGGSGITGLFLFLLFLRICDSLHGSDTYNL